MHVGTHRRYPQRDWKTYSIPKSIHFSTVYLIFITNTSINVTGAEPIAGSGLLQMPQTEFQGQSIFSLFFFSVEVVINM